MELLKPTLKTATWKNTIYQKATQKSDHGVSHQKEADTRQQTYHAQWTAEIHLRSSPALNLAWRGAGGKNQEKNARTERPEKDINNKTNVCNDVELRMQTKQYVWKLRNAVAIETVNRQDISIMYGKLQNDSKLLSTPNNPSAKN